MSAPSWTPAPQKGVIPLHPLTFGTILGKAFSALRHNPRVLFGFAVVLQLAVALVTAGILGAVLFTTFLRLDSVSPSSEDFFPILWGTIAINALVAIGLSLASVAFTAIMQGVVAADIGYAALGEKPTLRRLWQRMRPALWSLIGFSLLQMLFLFGVLAVAAGIVVAILGGGTRTSSEFVAAAVLVVVVIVLALIPLWIWLLTKLLLVPSILVFEHVRLRTALVRSWRLTRGRFWVALGVTFLINAIMGLAMNVVSVPAAMLSGMVGGILGPTGPTSVSEGVGLVLAVAAPQVLLLVMQAVLLVVQCTGAALIYLDCRMRYEGLDQTLQSYCERRDQGWSTEHLGDPFALDPQRAVTKDPPPAPAYSAPASPAPGYPGAGYPGAGYPAPGYPAGYAGGDGAPPAADQPTGASPASAETGPADDTWAPPGSWPPPGSGAR